MRRLLPAMVCLLTMAMLNAAQVTLSVSDVEEAIRIGETRIAADRDRFHAAYRFLVARAPVDYVDVITPFRRVVLAAGERAQTGDRSFGQRQALELLKEADGRFDFVVELTFHPLNTFVGVPAYDVFVVSDGHTIKPSSIDRVPRVGARVDGLPPSAPVATPRLGAGQAQPMLGGTVTARFAADTVDPKGAIVLIVTDATTELARVSVDLGRLR